MHDFNVTGSHRDELAPARALLTPTWVAALALLVANDHWLKGSGLLPGALTGKLSDFAGMIVAPVLLASLLRVRSRRGLALCHLAVAVVFAGIQLSAGFAAQWSALMGLVGHPWIITCDPTDLIALPFLLLSWKLLVPQMDPSRPALVPMQRTAVAALSVFGLWSTVATSDGSGIDPDGEWYEDVFGHVFVNNANDFTIALHIRPLRSDLIVNCEQVSREPGRLLSPAAFGEAEHWELPPRTNVAIEFQTSGCGAAMIAGEGIPPTLVFLDSLGGQQWFRGQTSSTADLGPRGLAVEFGEDGGRWIGGETLRFTPTSSTPELPQMCEAPASESRIDWARSVPSREVELLAVEAGVDGCYELLVQELSLVGGEVQEYGEPYPFYLCAPMVPFAAGDRVDISQVVGSHGDRELSITLLDPVTLATATLDGGPVLRRIRYLRGGHDPQFIGPAFNAQLVALPAYSCPWLVDEGCASVERPTALAIHGVEAELEPGVALELSEGPTKLSVMLGYARERALVDPLCADGSTRLDYDIDFIVMEEPLG
ncbi:MAG: hypothetical protein R6X02_01840 [Enhygromyxa sp.]